MPPIETFVFLDLETTGLPKEELNKTKITELSLIAVKRSHILETRIGDSPRVQQKLTLCLNPRRIVQPASSSVTGLCNDLLEHEPPFNKAVFDTINNFLNLLTKPVCLIAHNGIGFDFPILKTHLDILNASFPDDVLCADALHCFYDLDTKLKKTHADVSVESIEDTTNIEENIIYKEDSATNMQKENESTPKKSTSVCSINDRRKRKIGSNPKEISKVRRRIFFEGDSKPQKSYKLEYIYNRYLDRWDRKAHRAESDCNMLLECSVAKGEEFVQWVEDNHCRFIDVKSMTIGVPLGY